MVKICSRCIYDEEHIPNITFDSNSVCNYCKEYDVIDQHHPVSQEKFNALLKQIKGYFSDETMPFTCCY
ncbi:MAG: hypothetical protein KAW47_09375 [Thermoplasmatales archaeon]|nr:hypothetical protein [Thermoplasmatales archaeon]